MDNKRAALEAIFDELSDGNKDIVLLAARSAQLAQMTTIMDLQSRTSTQPNTPEKEKKDS